MNTRTNLITRCPTCGATGFVLTVPRDGNRGPVLFIRWVVDGVWVSSDHGWRNSIERELADLINGDLACVDCRSSAIGDGD